MENTEVNSIKQTDLAVPKLRKIPKPFSIESLIASNRPSECENADKVNNAIQTNQIDINSVPTTNFPTNIAAAAVAYNPWIHNYLMHQKFTEQFLDYASSNIPQTINSQLPYDISSLSVQNIDNDRNIHDKLFKQYMTNCGEATKFNEMFTSEFYKCSNSFNAFSPNAVQGGRNIYLETNLSLEKNDKNQQIDEPEERGGNRKDESESDDVNENDLESDCSSEVSLSLSRDGENDQQGISRFREKKNCMNLVLKLCIYRSFR